LRGLGKKTEQEKGEGEGGRNYVEALALVNESTSVSSHVDKSSLLNLPHGFVNVLQVVRDLVHVLDGPVVYYYSDSEYDGQDRGF
jgi:hypothetical protein